MLRKRNQNLWSLTITLNYLGTINTLMEITMADSLMIVYV